MSEVIEDIESSWIRILEKYDHVYFEGNLSLKLRESNIKIVLISRSFDGKSSFRIIPPRKENDNMVYSIIIDDQILKNNQTEAHKLIKHQLIHILQRLYKFNGNDRDIYSPHGSIFKCAGNSLFGDLFEYQFDRCNIIDNCRNLFMLSGPSVFHFYKNIHHKSILLLGETHVIKNICKNNKNMYEVQDWLYDVSSIYPDCLDIFLEVTYKKKQKPNKTYKPKLKDFGGPLKTVENKFIYLPFSNVRYHPSDIRISFGYHDIIPGWYARHFNLSIKGYKELSQKYNLLILIKYMIGLDNSQKGKEYYMSFVNELLTISDEIKYMNDFFYEKLKEYEMRTLKILTKELNKLSVDKNKFLDAFLESIDLNERENTLTNVRFDLYILSRLFIQFDKSKMSRGPKGCRSDRFFEIKNTIIYTGRNHTKFYVTFLNKMFNANPDRSIEKNWNDQCIIFNPPFKYF